MAARQACAGVPAQETPATATAWTQRASTASSVSVSVERVPSGLFVLEPCRMLDTREPSGPVGGPALLAQSARQFPATGSCGIPSTARALVANVTVVNGQTSGVLRATSGDMAMSVASVVPFSAGIVRGNNLVLRLSVNSGGTLAIRNDSDGPVNVILDVSGYFE
ncbi:MAG: hypothetical protein ABIT01_14475 [Thermoanaerobaculia bacterium]